MLWHSMKKKIEDWLDSKMLAFAQEESAGTRLSAKNWVEEYIYYDIHEVLFIEFIVILYEWLKRLATRQTNFQRREAVEWSDQLVHEVINVSNDISRAVDFGLTISCKDTLLSLR